MLQYVTVSVASIPPLKVPFCIMVTSILGPSTSNILYPAILWLRVHQPAVLDIILAVDTTQLNSVESPAVSLYRKIHDMEGNNISVIQF